MSNQLKKISEIWNQVEKDLLDFDLEKKIFYSYEGKAGDFPFNSDFHFDHYGEIYNCYHFPRPLNVGQVYYGELRTKNLQDVLLWFQKVGPTGVDLKIGIITTDQEFVRKTNLNWIKESFQGLHLLPLRLKNLQMLNLFF